MLGPWRCHWTQTAHSAQFGGEFCPHLTSPLRSKHFQQNESYFHILHINWDWMDYVTSVELFIDLKPRICKVCAYIPQKNLKRTGRTDFFKKTRKFSKKQSCRYFEKISIISFFAKFSRTFSCHFQVKSFNYWWVSLASWISWFFNVEGHVLCLFSRII